MLLWNYVCACKLEQRIAGANPRESFEEEGEEYVHSIIDVAEAAGVKKQCQGSSPTIEDADYMTSNSTGSDVYASQSSVRPWPPQASKNSAPGSNLRLYFSGIFTSGPPKERTESVTSLDYQSAEVTNMNMEEDMKEYLYQSAAARDKDEERKEREAEFDINYPEFEPMSPCPSVVHGYLKHQRNVNTEIKRIFRLRSPGKPKCHSDLNNEVGNPGCAAQDQDITALTGADAHPHVSNLGSAANKQDFSTLRDASAHPEVSNHFFAADKQDASTLRDGSVDADSIRARQQFRRCRSLSSDFGSQRPSKALQLIIENSREIELTYTIDKKELGSGSFGLVRKATVKATGAQRAVKGISKHAMKNAMRLIQMEIRICKMVDHPNIVKLYELFEDVLNVYLVLEHCQGGQLARLIKKRGPLNEKEVCWSLQQILRAIVYLHNHLICHRDVKPENVLLSTNEPILRTSLRLTDFGVSCLFKPNQMLRARVGTAAYMAPQVINKYYNERCDIWSAGVTMYFLTSGQLPFCGNSIKKTHERICSGIYRLTSEFVDISESGLDVMQKLLLLDQNARPTATMALKHKWFEELGPKAEPTPVPASVFDALRIFRAQNKFKKAALCLMACLLSKEQVSEAHEAFSSLDADGDGIVSVAEIRDRLRKDSASVSMRGVKRILQEMDKACKGGFEDCTYTEFIAANLDRERHINEELCRAVFSVFDQDCDGFITKDELSSGELFGKMTQKELAALISDLASKGYEQVEFDDFMQMMLEVPKTPKSYHMFKGFNI